MTALADWNAAGSRMVSRNRSAMSRGKASPLCSWMNPSWGMAPMAVTATTAADVRRGGKRRRRTGLTPYCHHLSPSPRNHSTPRHPGTNRWCCCPYRTGLAPSPTCGWPIAAFVVLAGQRPSRFGPGIPCSPCRCRGGRRTHIAAPRLHRLGSPARRRGRSAYGWLAVAAAPRNRRRRRLGDVLAGVSVRVAFYPISPNGAGCKLELFLELASTQPLLQNP